MIRRTVLAVAAAATLALPATAVGAGGPPDLKECQQSIGATIAAFLWGEWQSPECP